MEIGEDFEDWDWDWDENMTMELELMNANGGKKIDADTADGEISDESSSEEDEDGLVGFKCGTCGKVYNVKGWLIRHQSSCTGVKVKKTSTKNPEMSESQTRSRQVLSNLGFEDFFDGECVPLLRDFLDNLAATPADIAELRGQRFVTCQQHAKLFSKELEKDAESHATPLTVFLKYVAQNLWTVTFAMDNLFSSSRREQYTAEHLHAFRHSKELLSKWGELRTVLGIGSTDGLIIQKLISTIFDAISQHRSKSVSKALQIQEIYVGENALKPSLNTTDRSVVSYIAGYVVRKTRDRLQRQQHSERVATIVNVLSHMVPGGVGQQTPTMTFPNLLGQSLTRGGLTQVDQATYNFFCYLEVSIRPFLNLSRFRSSTRKSDTELLSQLVENSSLLRPNWPYTAKLPIEDSNLLLTLFVDLYFRVRKWAYLKVYKEQKKLKTTQALLKAAGKSGSAVDLHGKESLRKALMPHPE